MTKLLFTVFENESEKSRFYNIAREASYVYIFSKFSCLFPFVLRMSAVCLHLWYHCQLFVYTGTNVRIWYINVTKARCARNVVK